MFIALFYILQKDFGMAWNSTSWHDILCLLSTPGWYKGMPVAQDIYVVYVVQAGFYLHSIYATVFMDQWRRDFILMILHHILTFALLTFSFAIRYCELTVFACTNRVQYFK